MPQEHLEAIDRALLVISEARERAEQAARVSRDHGADTRVADALDDADRRLLAVHNDVMRAAYFPAPAGERQLELGGN